MIPADPEVPNSVIPTIVARVHVNVEPFTELVGVYVKFEPPQIAAGVNVLVR